MFDELSKNPEVLVQGITGKHGSFHTANMLKSGTRIVAGVTPGKAGTHEHNIPVYGSVKDALSKHGNIRVSIVFVPPAHAKAALLEAIDNSIPYIICITEGIPVHDMLAVLLRAKADGTVIIGPNCPGVMIPDVATYGIIPPSVGYAGNVAVVSRSGTLTYEAAASLTSAQIGQRYIVGIGGDRIRGTRFVECLQEFQNDPTVDSIVLIGEIGGSDEQLAADYISKNVTKPVFAYVVGHSAPPETQLGHAGAIMGTVNESAEAKTTALLNAGVTTATSLPELIEHIVHSRN